MQDHRIRFLRLACLIPQLLLVGCIYVPYPFANRNEITMIERSFLDVGETTRTDVLLHYGDPNSQREFLYNDGDERFFEYEWSGIAGAWCFGFGYAGGCVDRRVSRSLVLEFAPDGRLLRYELLEPKDTECWISNSCN